MRILLIHQYFLEPDDGGGSRFNEMTKHWVSQGHEIEVIAGMMHANGTEKRPEYKGKWTVTKQDENILVHRTHVSESYNNGFIGRLWGYFSFVLSSIYGGLFKTKGKFDVILVTSPPLFVGITAYVLSILKRVPFVFEIRDLWPESAIDTGVLNNKLIIKMAYWFESFIYKRAKLINVLTPAFRTKLIEKGVPKSKIIYIPNAADFSLSDELKDFDASTFKRELGLEDNFVITYVGAHGVANHLIQVLDAAEKIKHTSVVFQLIGEGMQKQKLIEEADRRQLTNIIFRDPVPKKEVFKYILSSDMGASILKSVDTFKTIYSNKTFDYMSCSKPVFLAIDGISKDLIEKAECGIFVEPENSDDWKIKIEEILSNQQVLELMGVNGREYALANFHRTSLSDKYIEHLKKLT